MSGFKVMPVIEREDVYENKNKNTFKQIDELLTMGINKNTIYREESLRKKRNEYSNGRHICKSRG